MSESSTGLERVSVYIDGFNFYNGLKAKGWGRYRWLDIAALSDRLLFDDQVLADVRYFTSLMYHQPESLKRQQHYLAALELHGRVSIHHGRFERREMQCSECGHSYRRPQEKETDVRMALQMVLDAMHDNFDVALVISADSDLVPAVEAVKAEFGKTVIIIHPPKRHGSALIEAADGDRFISRSWLNQSQFADPLVVPKRNGKEKTFRKPENWI